MNRHVLVSFFLFFFLFVPIGKSIEDKSGHDHGVVFSEDVIVADRSGNWSDVQTWRGKKVPQLSESVSIPDGITVSINSILPEPVNTLSIDGVLFFPGSKNAKLAVRTIHVSAQGALLIGTKSSPVNKERVVDIESVSYTHLTLPTTPYV